MRKVKKLLAAAALTLAALALVLVSAVLLRWDRTFDAPYPEIHASKDPAVIARGKYLVYGPAHCVACHTNKSEAKAVTEGAMLPLGGGNEFKLPVGTFYTPNLTPDPETGIGRLADRELARVLRYGVMPNGRATLPFMEFHDLSDDDLTALISFLRSQPAIRRAVPEKDFTFLGKAIMAFVIKPAGPSGAVAKNAPPEAPTVERGAYLANNVANCAGCHSRRSPLDGSYVSARFSGGMRFELDDHKHVLVTPNLTPSKVGRITPWSEEQFVGRFGAGAGLPGTHMPWREFQRISETDARAIYRYLRTLPPSDHDPGPSLQKKPS
ncbi:MAG TPA: c-type cytochrome [Thermoanaerobaculia bacterium]|jgi:mono/diheme cytochrome c family protein|nr:c-type cytochrome [Thermoanaerobaculia bacterium]